MDIIFFPQMNSDLLLMDNAVRPFCRRLLLLDAAIRFPKYHPQ